jgi:translation initiation factor 1
VLVERRNTRLAYSTAGEKEEEPPLPSARAKRLSVRVEGRPSNRVVTLVCGLPGSRDEVRAIGKALKSFLSTGGSVKETTVELQGDHKARVEEWLRSRLKERKGGGR